MRLNDEPNFLTKWNRVGAIGMKSKATFQALGCGWMIWRNILEIGCNVFFK